MQDTDYYARLGVNRFSPPEEITRAYRRLARQYHPDVNPDNSEADRRFKEINEAYQVLSDPEKRQQYDLELDNAPSPWQQAPSPTAHTEDEQPVAYQQPVFVHRDDVAGAVGDLAATVEEVASQMAGEMREALRGFGADLGELSRTVSDIAMKRQGFPPPRRNVRPPRGGRPPSGGRAPKP